MIDDSIITILSCNRPRTWKSYTPHRDQDKGCIKLLTYLNGGRILVIGMALVNCIGIVATPDQQSST